MTAKSIDEILKELESIPESEIIEVNLKQLLLVYKGIEDWRRFFHDPMHYSTIQEVEIYIGDKKRGMYSVIDHIYIKTFGALLPDDIEDRLE